MYEIAMTRSCYLRIDVPRAKYVRPLLDSLAIPSIFSSTKPEQPGTIQNATEDCVKEKLSIEPLSNLADHDLSQIEPGGTFTISDFADVKLSNNNLNNDCSFTCIFIHFRIILKIILLSTSSQKNLSSKLI